MRTYYLDKIGDIWMQANDGTYCCVATNVEDAMEGSEGIPFDNLQHAWGPLTRLVPDTSVCTDQLMPGLLCSLAGGHGGDHQAFLVSTGHVVKWIPA